MQERQLLANEVHDTLAQNLACMRMRATLLRDALQQDNRERAANYLEEVEVSLSVAHGRVRELITQFRTAMDPEGLLHALRTEIAGMDGLGGVELAFENRLPDLKLPAEQEMQILHIVREALANVVKHARARHGRVSLSQNGENYEILVEDDGVGLSESGDDGDSDHGHYGLNIMRERAQHLGGDVRVEDRPDGGTRLWLQFPVAAGRKEART
jgi:two-component system nitrate/nitrite sensor histidine kinase NarX